MAAFPSPRSGPLVARRDFMAGAGALFLAGLSSRQAEALERSDALFGAACRRADGSFGCAVFTEDGRLVSTVALPERGHDIAFDPVSRRAVAFARRPRTFALVFDPLTGAASRTLASPPGRHFFGHGFFSPDGRLLYATENDFDASRGLIGVYDVAADFARIGEFETHGIDTHEALLMADGETIVVANGGIETHPDYGRQKLNLPTMEPSLVFLDRRSGALLEKHVLPKALHQLSIRHLAIDAAGRVWFGCQYEGPAEDAPQLLGVAQRGSDLRLAELPRDDLAHLSNYVGSLAASRDGRTIALSSPVGGTMLVLDARDGSVLRRAAMKDGCGLAPDADGFLATSGTGIVARLGTAGRQAEGIEWDNHILAL
ncbi:DUF1513 domain-containing protein [Aurantimonas sp. Leaf443]|uniref:DUF1513 domain-containing protein n=1 Tax=Aurantimonas sp. Leaf443 TaxID=1736378 RepID=UPI0006F3DD83|nr:DUF1513 domain-containing protein [Aurantimonas sp. Leaf443]KQT85951.1 hypothetical protein ASG48_04980 [Aurantimonas sp. Leaf443]